MTLFTEQQDTIYTISRLNSEVRFILEDTFPMVWVEGEVSNFAAPNSGHWYFTLKDASAQVRCAMFKGHSRKLPFTPKDGMHVLIRARVSLYENRGEFQLIAEHMEERGEGKLRRAFELLKKKLEAAGLFDEAHKKPLPAFPTQIGVITSATGAAIRDILTVLKRRFPCVNVIIYPTLVQGDTAAPTIVKAIQTANRRKECDVLILSRGGGSLEDLWPFNEEIVAHAIHQSELPIISGIGHEVDFTIADFVADLRAPTPSAAAEIVTPDREEWQQILVRQKQQLCRLIRHHVQRYQQQLGWMQKSLQQQHPKRRLAEKMQRLDFCELTLVQSQTRLLNKRQGELNALHARLRHLAPTKLIFQRKHQLQAAEQSLQRLMQAHLNRQRTQLATSAAKLNALSPLGTLQRGYAIATHQNHVLLEASDVKQGDEIQVRLFKGILECVVASIKT